MSTLPDSVYDDAVRTYLRVPARHHISIGHLRATIDDPAAFRDALTVAYEAGAEDLRSQLRGRAPADLYATLDDPAPPDRQPSPCACGHPYELHRDVWEYGEVPVRLDVHGGRCQQCAFCNIYRPSPSVALVAEARASVALDVRTDPTMAPDEILIVGVDPETGKPSAAHSTVLKGVGVAEARASVALDGETVTLDEPQVTP